MEEKKYRLLENETVEVDGRTLYRIKALRGFGDVKKGDKGGYVESENKLSHGGDCWVYNDAMMFGNAEVYGNARVYGNAVVLGEARVYGNAVVLGEAKVFGNAQVYGNAVVLGEAKVFGNALVYGDAEVGENAKVYGKVRVNGKARVLGNAEVARKEDYIVFKNWWSSGRYFTWTRSNNRWQVGCFYGTGEKLIKKAYADSERSGREYERIVKYVEAILRDERE